MEIIKQQQQSKNQIIFQNQQQYQQYILIFLLSLQIFYNIKFDELLKQLKQKHCYTIKQQHSIEDSDGFTKISIIQQDDQNIQIKFVTDVHNQFPLYYNEKNQTFTSQYNSKYFKFQQQTTILSFNKHGKILNKQELKADFKLFTRNKYDSVDLPQFFINCLFNYFENLFKNQQLIQLNLSGGVDSTLLFYICKQIAEKQERKILVSNITFIKQYQDSEAFKYIIQHTQKSDFIQFKQIVITEKRFREELEDIKSLIKPCQTTIMNVNLTAIIYFSVNTSNTILISGLGPDEYFGAYKRFNRNLSDVTKQLMQEQAVEQLHIKNIQREQHVCQQKGILISYPYLQEEIIDLFNYIRELRYNELALKNLQCPTELYTRQKQAAQFGSGCSKILGGKSGYSVI